MRSVLRRWYFVLFGLVITAALCLGGYRVAPVSYQTDTSVLMLPPKVAVGPNGNPYLFLGGLGQALDVLSRKLQSDNVSKPILDANPGASFSAKADASTSGPILLITVTAKAQAAAMETMRDLMTQLPVQLDQLQTDLNVPEPSRISLMTLASDTSPKLVDKSRMQIVIGVAAVGAAGSLLLSGLLDSMLITRRTRRLLAAANVDVYGRPEEPGDATLDRPSEGVRPDEVGTVSARRRKASANRHSPATHVADAAGQEPENSETGSPVSTRR